MAKKAPKATGDGEESSGAVTPNPSRKGEKPSGQPKEGAKTETEPFHTVVIPNWDRYHSRYNEGETTKLYGVDFEIQENGDAVTEVCPDYAYEGMIEAGRAIDMKDHKKPAKPATAEEIKKAANAARAIRTSG